MNESFKCQSRENIRDPGIFVIIGLGNGMLPHWHQTIATMDADRLLHQGAFQKHLWALKSKSS